jgi:pimeloyl-ACP methyl ester carboxylesterase
MTGGPFYFGPERQSLAGWLHPSSERRQASHGVVFCAPFGLEALCAHRTIRHFAEAVAKRGLPALRFDYPGTGDSAGSAIAADVFESWIGAIGLAVETLRRESGVTDVSLVGVRLGAALAMKVASARGDIRALVAFAPVVRGRQYLRELRAFTLNGSLVAAEGECPPNGTEEVGGFPLPGELRAELTRLDLVDVPVPAGLAVMSLERDDLRPDQSWVTHLKDGGARVSVVSLGHFAEFMSDPHKSVVPVDEVQRAANWLASTKSPKSTGVRRRPNLRHMASVDREWSSDPRLSDVREAVTFIDRQRRLAAIVTEPVYCQASSAVPTRAVVLLNAGAVHRVGPGRLYVSLARQRAGRGDVVVRFDLAGLGDSPPHPGETENVVYSPAALEDVRAALEFVRARYGPIDCHLVGLCSGAYHAFRAAAAGLPVRGVIAINPLTFFWKGGQAFDATNAMLVRELQRYRQTARDWQSWRRLLSGQADVAHVAATVLRRGRALTVSRARELARWLHMPLAEDLAAELRAIADRGVDLQFVFAADSPGRKILHEQAGATVDALARRGALRIGIVEGADHTFTRSDARGRLMALVMAALDCPVRTEVA